MRKGNFADQFSGSGGPEEASILEGTSVESIEGKRLFLHFICRIRLALRPSISVENEGYSKLYILWSDFFFYSV